jgi:acyl-CoA thioesterase-1
MLPKRAKMIAHFAWAAAATAIFALHNPACAEMLAAAPFVAPEGGPVVTVAAMPTTMPSVDSPPAHSTMTEPAKPIAMPPAAGATPTTPVACSTPAEFTRLDHPLLRTTRRLAGNAPLTIVAIGSSSTAGAGASSPDASYPSRLAVELRLLFLGHDIKVFNRGVNGEETNDMMARFETGVIAEHPQLVLWQVGTNSVLRDRPLESHAVELHEGIEELKATGADVVLIDPQYAPKVLDKSETPGMVDQIALTAKEESVDLFRRFAVMRNWNEVQHLAFDTFLSPDQLHMNDWGYGCWAKILARAIAEASSRPIESAAAHATR